MKRITIILGALVLISLGFTVIDNNKMIKPDHEKLKQEFKVSSASISPYHQSRKDIATFD